MRLLPATLAVGFASFGITVGVTGPLVPLLRADIAMTWFQTGLFLAGQYLGQLAIVPAGALADRSGKKPFLLGACALTVAGLLGIAVAPSFGVLLAASIVSGAGLGGFEVGLNALQADLDRSSKAMNVLHLFFGVGAILGPFLATLALAAGGSWRHAFALAAALPLLMAALLSLQPVPRAPPAPRDHVPLHRSAALWLFGLGVAFYVGLETSTFGWLASWWARRGGTWVAATLVPSAFWITLTLGRVRAGQLADRVGPRRFLVWSGVALAVVAAGWALAPWPAVAFAAALLVGIFCAGIFPTAMVVATGALPGHAGKVMGFMVLFSALGGFAFPSITGRLADAAGIGVLPLVLAALSAAMALSFRASRLGRSDARA